MIELIRPSVSYFRFYDTETSGTSSANDQILQYASVKTDCDLVVDPSSIKNLLCKPRLDVIPHPMAFLTHHLSIDSLKKSGMNEFDFARAVYNDLTELPETSITGYNTSSFDNEMIRALFYRNMKGMYDHEWKNKNCLFDIFNLVKLAYSLRPEILEWPMGDNGFESLKLERLAIENGIFHENAHDALSDVLATISLAKIIKDSNPKLFDYCLKLSSKENVFRLISAKEPLIHVDSTKGKEVRMTSLVFPVVADNDQKNKFYMFDLREDPAFILDMVPEDINRFMFTKRADLPEGAPRIPICSVSTNKQPLLVEATSGVLTTSFLERASLDYDKCMMHLGKVKNNMHLARKIQEAFSIKREMESSDTYGAMYNGFFSRNDEAVRASMHLKTSVDSTTLNMEECRIHEVSAQSHDYSRNFDLFLRGKWNSFYESLLSKNFSPNEFIDWVDYLEKRAFGKTDKKGFNVEDYREAISAICLESPPDEYGMQILDELNKHVESIVSAIAEFRGLADSLLDEARHETEVNKSIAAIRARIELFRNARMERTSEATSDYSSMTM